MTIYRVTAAVLWTLIILTLCWLPKYVVQEVEKDSSWFQIPNFDKLVHWEIFLLFAILWLRVGKTPRRFLWVALAGLVLTVVSELVQSLPIIGRDATIGDGVTDCIGLLLGLALAPVLSLGCAGWSPESYAPRRREELNSGHVPGRVPPWPRS